MQTNFTSVLENQELQVTLSGTQRANSLGPGLGDDLLELLRNLTVDLERWFANDCSQVAPARVLTLKCDAIQLGERRIWIGGGDLKALSRLDQSSAEQYSRCYTEICLLMQTLPIPVIVAVDGQAIGGGAELSLCGDFRFATNASKLIFKQLEIGLSAGFGGTRWLQRIIGPDKAARYLLERKTLEAQQASELGIFTEIAEDSNTLGDLTRSAVKSLCQLSPQALRAQKILSKNDLRDNWQDIIDEQAQLFREIWQNPHHRKALDAFARRPSSK